jgi:SAM-dependent methyltransferase
VSARPRTSVGTIDLESHEWGSAPEFYGPRHAYREALMMRTLLPTLPGPRVLNAGCGAGSLTLRMLDAGLEVTSVDASEAFVERLRRMVDERAPGPGRSVAVAVADLHALDAADGSFDGVVCGEVLEHLDDDRRAMREFARVLAPGGVAVATVPANPWRYDWLDHWAGHRRRYTPEAMRERLEAAGFGEVKVASWGFPLTGLYHRRLFMPMLRRRLAANGGGPPGRPGLALRVTFPIVRAALELDTLFMGRRPGYFGLIAWARAPVGSGPPPAPAPRLLDRRR